MTINKINVKPNGTESTSSFNNKNSEKRNDEKKESGPSIKYKASSNSMARAMSGKLQQNITLERTFFKDLLSLSRQRY